MPEHQIDVETLAAAADPPLAAAEVETGAQLDQELLHLADEPGLQVLLREGVLQSEEV